MRVLAMFNPDGAIAKQRKELIDHALAYKKDTYMEYRGELMGLTDQLQRCKQKTKGKVDTLKKTKKQRKDDLDKYVDCQVQIALSKADLMVLEENKNAIFGLRENVFLIVLIIKMKFNGICILFFVGASL